MVVFPFSLFSPSIFFFFYLRWLQKKIGRRRRRREILLLTLLYKDLRGLKFWALNLGLPHEKKPSKIILLLPDLTKKKKFKIFGHNGNRRCLGGEVNHRLGALVDVLVETLSVTEGGENTLNIRLKTQRASLFFFLVLWTM